MRGSISSPFPTPLLRTSVDTFLKVEFLHPGRSHKARVARALIDDAEQRHHVLPGGEKRLLERTGGNLGIGLALEAAARGYELTLITDPSYSAAKRDLASRLGATVIDRTVAFPAACSNGDAINALLREPDGGRFHYLNQFGNPANPLAHERETGPEIAGQLRHHGMGEDTTVVLVCGMGTGASMRGITTALRAHFARVVSVAVQPAGCDIAAGVYIDHPLQGIAVGEPAPFMPVEELDLVVSVTGHAASDAVRQLMRDYRLFAGPSSGANYAALPITRHLLREARGPHCFVSILYDRGEDYLP
jgi:cysteine synthase